MKEMKLWEGKLMTDDDLRYYELYQKLQYLIMNICILPVPDSDLTTFPSAKRAVQFCSYPCGRPYLCHDGNIGV
jgi:hypothetical protein